MDKEMIETLVIAVPILTAMLIWIIRLESRLTKIETNLCWIKKEMLKCQQTCEESTN